MDPDTNVWTHNPHYYSVLHWEKFKHDATKSSNTWGEKLETKHKTFINDCPSLSTIFLVFDWLNLVYLLYICISSGIPSQNCCRECVMMAKLMTRTQHF